MCVCAEVEMRLCWINLNCANWWNDLCRVSFAYILIEKLEQWHRTIAEDKQNKVGWKKGPRKLTMKESESSGELSTVQLLRYVSVCKYISLFLVYQISHGIASYGKVWFSQQHMQFQCICVCLCEFSMLINDKSKVLWPHENSTKPKQILKKLVAQWTP